MKNFEYASPTTEAEAVELLNDHGGNTAILAGGTDLIANVLKAELLAPDRVVDIKNIHSLRTVTPHDGGVLVGALLTLEDLKEEPLLAEYRALLDVVEGVRAIQIQQMGTLGGDLCHLPNCWYFRGGYGLLGLKDGESLPATGDGRFHAILGNRGPAKFVNASRFAPAAIAVGAKVRIVGPKPDQEKLVPLEDFYISPTIGNEKNTILEPGQLITHVWLPTSEGIHSASYEVLETEGLDWPLGAASACLEVVGGIVRNARIVMGHVAPTPWVSHEAAQVLIGKSISEAAAQAAGDAAVAKATPLKDNDYKVQIARTAVKRAILRAAGQWEDASFV